MPFEFERGQCQIDPGLVGGRDVADRVKRPSGPSVDGHHVNRFPPADLSQKAQTFGTLHLNSIKEY
jgi:hypothetical protein